MFQILVVDTGKGETQIAESLVRAGYAVVSAHDGMEAMALMDSSNADLLIFDLTAMPREGLELVTLSRMSGRKLPMLIVTKELLPEEQNRYFHIGLDDFLVKPVNEMDLLLRVRALLRRNWTEEERRLVIGKIILDGEALSVEKDGTLQTLPMKEFMLLFKLLSAPNTVFTRQQLMDEIWGENTSTTETTINVHINRLRNRFRFWPEFEIVAIRGVGYKAVICGK